MELLDGVVYFRSKEEGHKLLFCNKEQKEEQHGTNSKSKANTTGQKGTNMGTDVFKFFEHED